MNLEVLPLVGIPLVQPGDDLAALVAGAAASSGVGLRDGDVVIVTGKVVSKAEGRLVPLSSVEPSDRARRLGALTEKDPRLVELVLRESVSVVRARPGNLLVRHRRGWVSGVAGIDRSNVEGDDHALLLPEDPDRSADVLRRALRERAGVDVGVVVSDSHGRPFRIGNTGVAIGAAGVVVVEHLEGRPDLYGRPLTTASVVPVADLLASAAMLVCGEADEAVPVVVVRGFRAGADGGPATALIRDPERDLFAVPDQSYD